MAKKQISQSHHQSDGCFVQAPDGHISPMEPEPNLADIPDTQDIAAVDPANMPVKPFVSTGAAANLTSVETEHALALPLSRWKVSLAKAGFPRLENEIEAVDPQQAEKKFFAMHGIGRSENRPEVTLIGAAAAMSAA